MKIAYEEEEPGIVQYKIPLRWNWQFADNPFVNEKDGTLPIWIAIKGDEIAGQMCAMPMRMKIGDHTYDGGWGCDFIVLKKFRGEGIGWLLNKAYCDYFQVVVHITYANSTKKIWEKLESIPVSPVSIMWNIVKLNNNFVFRYLNYRTESRPSLNRLITILCKYFFLHYFIAFCGNTLTAIANPIRMLSRKNTKAEITEINEFDEDFAAFIDTASTGYDSLVKREPQFLRWKYIGNPMMQYHLFVLRKNEDIKGYVVLRKPHPAELNIGIIADIFAARGDEESVEALVSHAIAFFGKSVNVIQVLVSLDFIVKILQKHGFITIKTSEPHFVCSDPALREKLKEHTKEWFVTYADHDQDQIVPIK